MNRFLCLSLLALLSSSLAFAQPRQEGYSYIVGGIEVQGAEFSDKSNVLSVMGIAVGERITVPGIQISDALKRLWKLNVYSDIQIQAERIVGNKIFLVVQVKERPRISQFSFQGISKSQADDLREKINFIRGTILTESKQISATRIIRNFYVEKGFYNVDVAFSTEEDPVMRNGVVVNININKGTRVRIDEIRLVGNEAYKDAWVLRKLKKVKQKAFWRFWSPSKFIPKTYEEAQKALVEAYNAAGYRDMTIAQDTVYATDSKHVRIEMRLDEGIRYYHRDIVWSGNYKYNSLILSEVLGIKKGDTYDKAKIDKRLFGDPNGSDVSSLYLDDGYLFFNVQPVEVLVEGDSIDLEFRVVEGPQATIRRIIIEGNTKTSDEVIRREIRTAPGQKFSRSDIIRSQREILALNYFDQEKLNVTPIPDAANGTVDIKYTVEERPSDQLQLQGGWTGRTVNPITGQTWLGGFVGTVQLGFNNFSTRRMFDPKAWRPVPSGDGQQVNLAIQMNGRNFQNYSFTFVEPWFGGKRPNSLGFSTNYFRWSQINSTGAQTLSSVNSFNVSLDYGRRLRFPDDFFTSRTSLGYKFYDIFNPAALNFQGFESETDAFVHIFTLRQSFDRSSVDAPIYPRSGSTMSFSVELTPPYSLFRPDRDYSELGAGEKYRLLEYHKWRFKSQWYHKIAGNLVLHTRLEAAFLGAYNREVGVPPFERHILGGAGLFMNNFNFNGQQILALRGYENQSLSNNGVGYPIYSRFVAELRYPLSLNQSAPIWVQTFLEGGNGYTSFRDFNPFNLRRAAGAGLRVMLPMVGLLGLDWAYGFDSASDRAAGTGRSGSQFHFILGQEF
jgi:outer membrane protein insertion porin family